MTQRLTSTVRQFLTIKNHPRLIEDMFLTFRSFPLKSIRHLEKNTRRLARRVYKLNNRGCIYYLLSEPLDFKIDTREKLFRWFKNIEQENAATDLHYRARCVLKQWDGVPQTAYELQEVLDSRTVRFVAKIELIDRCMELSQACHDSVECEQILSNYENKPTDYNHTIASLYLERDLNWAIRELAI